MIPCFLHVPQNRQFIRFHAVHVHVPRSGHQILRIRVFSRQTIGNLMAAVVDIFAADKIILFLRRLPAGRFHHADCAALLLWKKIRPDARDRNTGTPFGIQRTEFFVRYGCVRKLCFCEIRDILIETVIRYAVPCGDFAVVKCFAAACRRRHMRGNGFLPRAA